MRRTSASAGYSGTPLPKKLGFKDGMRAALAGEPKGFPRQLEPLPADVEFIRDGKDPLDLVIL
ncbi:MAG TPA: hypothetical protein VGQ14_01150, partial [Candidatus Eisenbacteria bacterium]|nr:hypothetical protein [Candidatus Eisenbacteria bacterium]